MLMMWRPLTCRCSRAWVGRYGTEVKQVGMEFAWLVLMEELFLYMLLANWATLRGRQRTRRTVTAQSCQNEHVKWEDAVQNPSLAPSPQSLGAQELEEHFIFLHINWRRKG